MKVEKARGRAIILPEFYSPLTHGMRRVYAKLLPLLLPLAGYLFLMHRIPNTVCTWDRNRPRQAAVSLARPIVPDRRFSVSNVSDRYAFPTGSRKAGPTFYRENLDVIAFRLEKERRQEHIPRLPDLSTPFTSPLIFRGYIFNCSNIHHIKIIRKVGHGVSKQTYLGTYHGMRVAVKMVTRHVSDIQNCLKRHKERGDNTASPKIREQCFVLPSMKLMKEVLFLEQLSHPNLIKLLGYCVRSEETDTTDLSEHGIIAVHEFGEHFMLDNLRILPWQVRLRHAHQLVSLLNYLENSPIGSLRISDFKETHFLLVRNKKIKMIDLDDMHNIEPKCQSFHRPQVKLSSEIFLPRGGDGECEYNLPCRMALCLGHNAKFNLDRANGLFLKRLLFPSSFPENITRKLESLNVDLDTLSISTGDLLRELGSIQRIADEILLNLRRKART